MVDSTVLTPELKQKLTKYCFTNLKGFLEEDYSAETLGYPEEFDNLNHPLFVTWMKYDEAYKACDLRGCIGTFAEGQPLGKTL